MKIEIKNRFTGDIILCGEYKSVRDCLEKNKKANLSRADLSEADLSWAKIFDEALDKTPIQILGLRWNVFITKQNIKIGCEVHKVDEWKAFKDSRIKLMDSGAVDWWKIYKPVIMQLHEEHIKAEH